MSANPLTMALRQTLQRCAFLIACLPLSVHAAEIKKAAVANTNALHTATAWVGAVLPSSIEVALWDSTVTATNAASSQTLTSLGDSSVTVGMDGALGGLGSIGGNLTFAAGGALDVSSAMLGARSSGILSVNLGKTITLDSFSFADIVGWNAAAADDGIYTLLNGGSAVVFSGSTPTVASPIWFTPGEKMGYFQQGSLQAGIVTVPESSSILYSLASAVLLLRRRRKS